jgi:hypothetical protein
MARSPPTSPYVTAPTHRRVPLSDKPNNQADHCAAEDFVIRARAGPAIINRRCPTYPYLAIRYGDRLVEAGINRSVAAAAGGMTTFHADYWLGPVFLSHTCRLFSLAADQLTRYCVHAMNLGEVGDV